MKKKTKIIMITLIAMLSGLLGGYMYLMKGGERNLQTEDAAFKISAKDLSSEFNADAAKATKKYLNKAVEISGVVTSDKNKEMVLNTNIICTMQEPVQIDNGHNTCVKGRILGFDDLMGEIKLDQCYLIK